MGHNHSQGDHHGHDHAPANYNRIFAIGIILNLGFVAAEAFAGIVADSLALLADAGHNLSDVLGLVMAWAAHLLSQRHRTARRTYGWKRTSILAALANSVLLFLAIGGITWEAIRRFASPVDTHGHTVVLVAAIGIVINTATALLFVADRKKDLNIRGAFLHMAADAGVSAGVVGAGFAMASTGWHWIDPTVSLTVVAIILVGTWGLFKDSANLALDAVPRGIDAKKVEEYLCSQQGVSQVHDLHIWGMSTTETALTAHLVVSETIHDDTFLKNLSEDLLHRFKIAHMTIQIEHGTFSPEGHSH